MGRNIIPEAVELGIIVPSMEQQRCPMRLDANDLILFAQIMEAGSFCQVRRSSTGSPKSTLSRRISGAGDQARRAPADAQLRAALAITEFGERILDHAKRLLDEVEAASAMALHRQGTPRGVLRVSMPPDFARAGPDPHAPPLCAASYPEVRLELDLSPRRVDLLAERFDLAVRAASRLPDDGTLVARKLCDIAERPLRQPGLPGKCHGIPASPPELLDHVGLRLIGGTGDMPCRGV
jgi:DNA-binding transcriptional LysR family regulator